jgi:hypothetical protein
VQGASAAVSLVASARLKSGDDGADIKRDTSAGTASREVKYLMPITASPYLR